MKKLLKFKLFIVFLTIALISLGFIEGDKKGRGLSKRRTVSSFNKINESGKNGDSYRLQINNLDIPLNNVGTIADVNIPGSPHDGALGWYGNSSFLFSSGFFISGYTGPTLWASAQASASLVENFVPGPVRSKNDPNAVMYVVRKDDDPFSKSWQDWTFAVELGADFYDGDGDSLYTLLDKDGDGMWDPDEDAPDMLGDETVWCIYHDGQPSALRDRFVPPAEPQGVEIKQTVFAFASKGAIGNIIFVRYRISNAGTKADTLKSVIFSVWADPDLGTFGDDLVGVDTNRNAGFTYNDGVDDPGPSSYGANPPCFIIDFFSGPVQYIAGETYTDIDGNNKYDQGIDTPLDTAYSNRGLMIGKKPFPGAKNLPISSFVHYQQSDPVLGDPNTHVEARNYMLGFNKIGETLDPCTFNLGQVRGGVDCSLVDPRFWYSGDPVTNVGWINSRATDQRQMTNIGPFDMPKNEEIEITVAYVVGQGNSALNSITEAIRIDDGAQFIFDQNFAAPTPPPIVRPFIETGEDFIDLIWETPTQVNYINKTDAYDLHFQGYNVYAFNTNSTQPTVGGVLNSKLLTSYDISDTINNIFRENAETGGVEKIYPISENPIERAIYSDTVTGRIRLRITKDPFAGGPLIKGKPYYFSITSYALNYEALYRKTPGVTGDTTDWVISAKAFVGEVENIPKIINYRNQNGIVVGEDLYGTIAGDQDAKQTTGPQKGSVKYMIVTPEKLTGDTYSVKFHTDTNPDGPYSPKWSLTNLKTGVTLIDSSSEFNQNFEDYSGLVYEGFIPRIQPLKPAFSYNVQYYKNGSSIAEEDRWFRSLSPIIARGGDVSTRGLFYPGKDLSGQSRPFVKVSGQLGTYMTADKLRKVELRFGTQNSGKAYRYLNGFKGANLGAQLNSYVYAAGITANDTVGKGVVGKLGEGFVDVPFTAWVVDSAHGETRQLAVGFVETRAKLSTDRKGFPDGIWDPKDSVSVTLEAILIFNSDYDPTGSQIQFTGGVIGTDSIWANPNKGFNLINPNATPEQIAIAKSPWFNTMYVAALERNQGRFYGEDEKLVIPVSVYPYTSNDEFQFSTTPGGLITDEQKKNLFNRVNVYPNPLYGFNAATSYNNGAVDEPFVTFSNLPEDITIKIYSLSGSLLRTLTTANKAAPSSPTIKWNLQNESGLRVASGMYLAIVSSPQYGEKILKFAVILPQKQIQKY